MDGETVNLVIAGNLMCCPKGLDPQTLEAVTASLLFSQLTADQKASRFDSPESWIAEHNTALRVLKYTGIHFEGQSFEPDETDIVTIESIVERELLPLLGVAEAAQIRRAVRSMTDYPENSPCQLFRRSVLEHSDKASTNGAAPTKASIGMLISSMALPSALTCLWISFKTTGEIAQDLFVQPFTGADIKGVLEVSILQCGWNAEGYKDVQPKVQAFLAGRQRVLTMPLTCDDPTGTEDLQG